MGADDPGASVADTVPADNTCYRYRYLVADHVGNVATYTAPTSRCMTTPVASLTPTDATMTPVSGIGRAVGLGLDGLLQPRAAGQLQRRLLRRRPVRGIAQVDFPAIAGFSGGGAVAAPLSGTTFRTTYAWSANGASPSPGAQAISATNNAGRAATNAAAFAVVKDDVGAERRIGRRDRARRDRRPLLDFD